MDEGTDARDVLENKLLPLRRGKNVQLPQFFGFGNGSVWEFWRWMKGYSGPDEFLAFIIFHLANIERGCTKNIL